MNNVVFNLNYDKKTNLINTIRLAKLKEMKGYEVNEEYLELKNNILKSNIHSINTNIILFENLYSDYKFNKEKAFEYAYFEMEKSFDRYEPAIAKKTEGKVKGCSFWWYSQSGIRNGIKKAIREDLGVKSSEFKILNFTNAYFKNNGELPTTEVYAKSYLKNIKPDTFNKALKSLSLEKFINFDKEEYRQLRYDILKSAKRAVKGINFGTEVLVEHFINGKSHKEYASEYNLTVNQVRYITRKVIEAFELKLKFDNIDKNALASLKELKQKRSQ